MLQSSSLPACAVHSSAAASKTDAKHQRIAAKSNQWLQRPRVRHRMSIYVGLTQLLAAFFASLQGSLVSYTTLASSLTSSWLFSASTQLSVLKSTPLIRLSALALRIPSVRVD